MRRKFWGCCGMLLFGSFGMLSGAFASTEPSEREPMANQIYQCTITWSAGSDVCKSRGATSNCTTKYQGEHASEGEAKERCEHIHGVHLNSGALSCDPCWTVEANQSPVERCKLACDVVNRICIARCRPKGNKECMNRCNQDTADCYRDCERQ